MKKTDLVKGLAKKLEGKMKTAGVPARFAQGAAAAASKRDAHALATAASAAAAPKLVPLACRLPADLLNRLRERATTQEGGINALIALALAQHLDATSSTPPTAG
ncbi:MAG: hypothetical protein AB9M53_08645 [Leptothrix sp. (in: b-proteobacteria)]